MHTNEIVDLYGGDYYIDASSRKSVSSVNNSAALAGSAFVNQKLQVGDVVYRDYDGFVASEGVFGQVEYNKNKLSAFAAASISNNSYWRYDRFYYDKENARSSTANFIGWSAKGGINYNITEQHNVFANIGHISRAPFFSGGVFLNSTVSNAFNKDAVNEKIFSVEVGYGFRSQMFSANINAYYTKWKDKTMAKFTTVTYYEGSLNDVYNPALDIADTRAVINMQGVNAVHKGIELDFVFKPLRWLDVNGMFSIGDWYWANNADGQFTVEGQFIANGTVKTEDGKERTVVVPAYANNLTPSTMTLNLKDVKTGGSAQLTAALGANARINKSLGVGLDWNLFANNYADWQLSSNDIILNGTKNFETPWKIPVACTFDLNAYYRFDFGKVNATLSGNINNLFNQTYITDAMDGSKHDWQTAYNVFYGFGRTFNIRLKIGF